MKNEDYAYAVARIRANERYLLSKNDIEALIAAKNFDEAVILLSQKGWLIKDSEKVSVSKAVKAQNKKLWSLLCESVPDKSELEVFTVQNDFFNIKSALKCFFSGKDAENYFAYPTSLNTNLIKQAVETRDFSVLGENFKIAAKEAYDSLNRTQTGQLSDIILDKAALLYMNRKANESCQLIRDIISFICTCANIKIAFRSTRTEKSLSFTREALAPCGNIETEALAKKASEGEKSLISYLEATEYKKAAELISTDTTAFEKWTDDEITRKVKDAKLMFLGFEPIAAYFYAKQSEIKTVRLILCAKESGLEQETIRKRVRELYV